jgi:hypothetical protein
MRDRPSALFGAAGVLGVQAAGLCIASVLAAIDTIDGQAYQRSSGIALTLIGFCAVAALGWVAVGVIQARRWSWTPAMLIQLFTLIVGIYLLQGHRYNWGVPAVALAVVAAVLLLLPRSLDALGRKPPPAGDKPAKARADKPARSTAKPGSGTARPAKAGTKPARSARPATGGNRSSRPRSSRP